MKERPRIIAGSARSGTTWVLDVLARTNNLRSIFEPLHPQAVLEADPYASRYLSAGADAAGLEMLFNTIFAGTYHSIWTDYRIRPRLLKPTIQHFSSLKGLSTLVAEWRAATKRVIQFRPQVNSENVLTKMIRANLMLGWLREKYDARIVLIVRHPGAVVESKLRVGGRSWDPAPLISHYRKPGVLGEYESRYRELLDEDLNPAEVHTLAWCIENQLPQEQAEGLGYLTVYYESLVADEEREWQRIKDALELDVSPYGSAIVGHSSQNASIAVAERSDRITRWSERISAADLEAIQGILEATGVGCYSAYDPLPRVSETQL